MHYKVKLKSFEGPLDLLLHLIQQNDLDLYDIPVQEITDQYMVYIHTMRVLHLDIASEYLVMASTLLYMKSQMLLPVEEDELFDDDFYDEGEVDSREDLMRRLIEYKKFKEAAEELKDREFERSELFSRPMTDLTPLLDDGSGQLENPKLNVSIYDMLQAFQKIQKRKKASRPKYTRVHRDEIPIEEKMHQIMDYLTGHQGKCMFSDLFEEVEKYELVVSFMALLELMKEKEVFCHQEENFADFLIYKKEAFQGEK